jgi:hypothetical protein
MALNRSERHALNELALKATKREQEPIGRFISPAAYLGRTGGVNILKFVGITEDTFAGSGERKRGGELVRKNPWRAVVFTPTFAGEFVEKTIFEESGEIDIAVLYRPIADLRSEERIALGTRFDICSIAGLYELLNQRDENSFRGTDIIEPRYSDSPILNR